MKNLAKLLILGLLLVPIMMVINFGTAYGKMPAIVIPTDNGSTNVEVTIEKGMVNDGQFTIDQPELVTFNLRFLDPTTSSPIEHLNYQLIVTDASGNMVHKVHGGHAHTGMNTYSLFFPNTGSFTLTLELEGTGAMKPYDDTYTGTASSSVTVTPEFPLSVMAIMAAVVGIGIAATRFKNSLKL